MVYVCIPVAMANSCLVIKIHYLTRDSYLTPSECKVKGLNHCKKTVVVVTSFDNRIHSIDTTFNENRLCFFCSFADSIPRKSAMDCHNIVHFLGMLSDSIVRNHELRLS